jgi:hypothetical protein
MENLACETKKKDQNMMRKGGICEHNVFFTAPYEK